MVAFAYRAADSTGCIVEGVLDGASEAVALRTLEQQSLTPLTLRRARNKRAAAAGRMETTRIRLRPVQLLEFTRQLKVMLKSGITLLSALGILRAATNAGNYRRMLDRIAGDIAALPEVTWLTVVTGSFDLIAEVVCRDSEDLLTFLAHGLHAVEGVRDSETLTQLKVVKEIYY